MAEPAPGRRTSHLGKDALLDAAAVLFDERGVDGVSLNEIVRSSGHRNRSAILYHFGSKDEVVKALLARSMAVPDNRRSQLLDELLRDDPHPTMAAVATVVVQPMTESLDTIEGRRHLRLVAQLFGHPRLLASALDILRGNGSMARCTDLAGGEITHLPAELRLERVTLLVAFVTRAYADQARLIDAEDHPRTPLPAAEFTAHIVGLILAILAAPAPAPIGDLIARPHRAGEEKT
jgi:AcrR family transcriptional regulator